MYAVWDDDNLCDKVLRNHQPLSKARHRFRSIDDGVSEDDWCTLREIQKTFQAKLKELQEDKKNGLDHKVFVAKKVILAADLIHQLTDVLENVHFEETAWCYNCQKHCFVSPRSCPEFRDSRWSEIAGITCNPWSPMNASQSGVFDDATLTEMIWAFRKSVFDIAFSLKV